MEITEDNKCEDQHLALSELTTRILGWHCMWPKHNPKPFDVLKFGIIYVSLYIVTIGLIGHLKHYLDYNSFSYLYVADDVAGITSSNSVMYIFVAIFYYQRHVRETLYALGDFSRLERPTGIKKVNDRLNFLTKLFAIWLYVSMGVVWVLCLVQTCEDGDESDCGLVLNAWLPIDIFRTPHRQIFMTLQVYSAFSSGICAFFIAWLHLSISEYLIVWLNHFKHMIEVISTLNGRRARKAQIKKCVLYQYFILEIAERFYGSAKHVFIIHITCAPIVMSTIFYQLLCKFMFVNAVHFGAWFAAIVIACLYGEHLIITSSDLGPVIYNNFPDDGDVATKRDMLLMLLMSQREMNIPCGKFGSLSHFRLMGILKAMYSFLTILVKTM